MWFAASGAESIGDAIDQQPKVNPNMRVNVIRCLFFLTILRNIRKTTPVYFVFSNSLN